MRDTVVRQLLAEYGQRRNQELQEAYERKMRLLGSLPGYFDLERELASAYKQISTYRLQHPEEPAEQMKEKSRRLIDEIHQKQDALLAQAHLTPEDLKPHFRCPLCEDTGYVGEPVHTFCACFKQELSRRLYEDASLSGQTFADFKLDLFADEGDAPTPRQVMQRVERFCMDYAEKYPQVPQHSLLFLGPTGAGKTFLLNCIGAALVERGVNVLRISAFRLAELMRNAHRGMDEDGLQTLLHVDVLGIDDLGTEPLYENITLPYLQYLLDERLQKKRGTVITTNLTLAEMQARYSERIFSRLTSQSTRVLRLNGQDVRIKRG